MIGKWGGAGDEISVPRLVVSLVVLLAGAVALATLPFLTALSRLGWQGTAVLVVGIVAASLVFYRAYEHLTPSSPPTPRRDLAIILFSALLIGLWTFLFTNELVTVVVLGVLGAIVLAPEDWPEWVSDRLPRLPQIGGRGARGSSRGPLGGAARQPGAGRFPRNPGALAAAAGGLPLLILTYLHPASQCSTWVYGLGGGGLHCADIVLSPDWRLYPDLELQYLVIGFAVGVVTYFAVLGWRLLRLRASRGKGSPGSASGTGVA